MMWLLYTLASVVISVGREITQKRALKYEPTIEYLAVRNVFITILSLLIVPFVTFTLSIEAYGFILLTAVLLTISIIHRNRALKSGDISVVEPLMNLQPIFVTLIAFMWLGERLSWLQITGISFIAFGTYWLETDSNNHSLTHTIRKLCSSTTALHVILAAVILALSNSVSRHVLTTYTDYLSYFVLVFAFTSLFLLVASITEYSYSDVVTVLEKHGWQISVPAVLTILGTLSLYKAFSLAKVGLVSALFQVKSVITTIEGGEYFHEHNLHKRIIACAIITCGAVLVIV